METLTLQQLVYFLTAVERGSLSAAAEALYLSQPSLSEQVRRLERHLGAPLFLRTNRRLVLTDAGERLLPHAQATVAAARAAEEAVRAVGELREGTASFGMFGTAHHYFMTELVAEFRRAHPAVRLQVFGHNSSEVADLVRDGRLEAGLVMVPVDDRGLDVTEPVWSAEVGYASAEPARLKEPKTIEALAVSPLILSEARWSRTDPIRAQLNARADAAGLGLHPAIEVEFQTAALELAAAGLGDTVASLPILRQRGYDERLGWVPLSPPLWELFAFVTRRDAEVSPATAAVMHLARRHLNRLRTRHARAPRPGAAAGPGDAGQG